MIIFRIRDFLSVMFYRLVWRYSFKRFGKKVHIVFPLRIMGSKYITLGDRVTLQMSAFINAARIGMQEPNLVIEAGTMVGNFAHIICTQSVIIREKVLIADKVYISDNLHTYENIEIPVWDQPIKQINPVEIGRGTWIGENVCIIGAKIGRNCVIGANSVVTKDVPDYCIAAGSPAVIIKRYCSDTASWKKTDASGKFVN